MHRAAVKLIRRASLLFGRTKMEVDGQDLACSQDILTRLFHQRKNEGEGATFTKYLEGLSYPPICEFPHGLEWFNVSEPISIGRHLKGKVVVLDFFTYCCINCMHIIPELRELENEFSVEDGLVVIGVHSAKFDNEKHSANILAAVQRYNISHPVVNDHHSAMWRECGVHCWPTLLMLGPNANPIVMLMGEGHKDALRTYIRHALDYYKAKNLISNHSLPQKSAFHLLPIAKGPLLFPGKICSFFDKTQNVELLAISDTGNHRILIVNTGGVLLEQVGGRGAGFRDGTLDEAQFNSPQGLTFKNKDILYVADTENHAIRRVDLAGNCVETVAGTGVQGCDRIGGRLGKVQEISSPWDVCVFTTPDMDMSFHASVEETPLRDVLLIAMAGTHQIWGLFMQDTIWWKFKRYNAGICASIAGSGREENRNNQYPHAAAFAQPSGLALNAKDKEVYIADSESSSIRKMSLVDGKVTGVVGGDRNPTNLFAFGDLDGTTWEAKLQHMLGVAVSDTEHVVYVADTYNHKLKKLDLAKNTIHTLTGAGFDACDGRTQPFNEPGGLCVSADGKKLYVADTNNHMIKIVELGKDFTVRRIRNLELVLTKGAVKRERLRYEVLQVEKPICVSAKGGKTIVNILVHLENGLKFTQDAEQKWWVDLPGAAWSSAPCSGANVTNLDAVVTVPPHQVQTDANLLEFVFNLVTCDRDLCMPKNFVVQVPVVYRKEGDVEAGARVVVSLKAASVSLA